MRLKLFLIALCLAFVPALAQQASVTGVVVNASNGSPVGGASVLLRGSGFTVSTSFNGDFVFTGAKTGADYIVVTCDGYQSAGIDVNLVSGSNSVGVVRLQPIDYEAAFGGNEDDLIFDEAMLDDEEGSSQSVSSLAGSNDDLFSNVASFDFKPMYYRFRGLDNMYQAVYINGLQMNDLIRGRFNFSSLLGMTSRAFRNKTSHIGLAAANYGFGDFGGAVNYNTMTDLYAPGFNGSVAFTNSNYMLRGMVTYSSGLNKNGWAYTVSAIGRYAKEGVVEGTFYNSGGLFLSVEKYFNENDQLTFTAYGGPTQRATGSPVVQEAYDLVDDNLYNPNWGWYQGEKRSARITETYDPTLMLNWLHRDGNTTINTAAAVQWVHYNRSALQYYNANNPSPAYYKNLPSYYADNEAMFKYYTRLWQTDQSVSQINWDKLYYINELNNVENQSLSDADKKGSSYILENRINNQFNVKFNSYINTKLNDIIDLQGGVSFNYTNSSNYKTIRDLMGGEFWLDVDPFSSRDETIAPLNLQNDLDNPNRRVGEGDKFGYDYNFYVVNAKAWLQNTITLPHWDLNYGMQVSYTQLQRDGHMRNGRAPFSSKGKGEMLHFDNMGFKAGALYKIDGRNQIAAHAEYGTRAPLADNIYLAPRVKNDVVANVESERVFAVDASYIWSYRRFRGAITGFYTQTDNGIERNGFYDETFNGYTNYVIQGVKKVYKGVELAMAYNITPSITTTFAGMYSRYQYKNNPTGTRTFENGLHPDTTQTIYLKNYYVGSTPQYCANLAIDWAAPGNWFFNVNATTQGDAYVNLAPAYHEAMPDLWQKYPSESELSAKIDEISGQEKLKNSFTLNASIGKVIYISKVALNFNLQVYNILNNRDVVTYAYQQGRLDTKDYNMSKFPNRYTYDQGFRLFFNVGVRF